MNVNVNLIKENEIEMNGGITINVDVSVKNIIYVKKNYIWNPSTCICENRKYLARIVDDSVTMCDEVKKKQFQQILIKRKQPVKRKVFIFHLNFY